MVVTSTEVNFLFFNGNKPVIKNEIRMLLETDLFATSTSNSGEEFHH